jgi:hypothetical protein
MPILPRHLSATQGNAPTEPTPPLRSGRCLGKLGMTMSLWPRRNISRTHYHARNGRSRRAIIWTQRFGDVSGAKVNSKTTTGASERTRLSQDAK